jgi:hypothetical protein
VTLMSPPTGRFQNVGHVHVLIAARPTLAMPRSFG